MPHTVRAFFLILLAAFCSPISGGEQPVQNAPRRERIEADWLLQEQVRPKGNAAGKITPQEDAVGGCDGVKDGKNVGYYGFHTNQQDKPWWQVDLGTPQKLARTVIYNGSTPADAKRALGLCVLVSNDAKQWTEVYRHDRSMFCGPKQPLTVPLHGVEARHVRVQLPYVEYLHLDEIEVYAVGSDRNLALHRPATQSSVSQWSQRESPAAASDAAKTYLAHAQKRLKLARKTLEFVERTAPRPEMAKELEVLEGRLAASVAVAPGSAAAKALFHAAAALRRRIIFSHPLLDFDRIVFTKRPPPLLCAPGDNYYAINNGIGPGLTILDGWKSEKPVETVLLQDRLPPGCMMHPDISFDGRRVVFAYCDHTPRREERQFFLYEAKLDGTGLRQLTGGPHDRREGLQGRMTVVTEDYDPCYLPDGGIAFISTRNQGGVRCHWGGRYCPTYLLYRCDNDGSHIRQLSFGEANEWDPMVMPDGQILWTRWDYVNRPVLQTMGLWTIRPDGTAPAHYFGNYTSNPMKICQARPIPGSSKIVATTAAHHAMQAGSLILIDRRTAEDGLEAITRLTPEATFPESEPTSPVAFSTPYPLSENLFLAACSPYPLPASMSHKPRRNAFGIYLVDSLGGRELIYRDEEISCFAPMPVRPRFKPPLRPSSVTAADTPAKGIFYIQDVNQSTQPIAPGTIKSVRVNEILLQPTQRAPRSSVVTFEILKRIVGTVPVEADGSAIFEAPAGIPIQFQALDENGMAVLTMRTMTQLQPGEVASCVGCHEPRTSTPVARQSKPPTTPRPLTPPEGPQYEGGLSFAKTVQPVLDRYCIDCHGLDLREKSKISLLGTTAAPGDLDRTLSSMHASQAYHALARDPYVKVAQYFKETWYSVPKDYFAHAGTLVPMLLEGHKKVQLDRSSLQRIIDWADLNAQFSGTYSWNKDEWREIDGDGEQLLRDQIRDTFGEELAKQPFAALVNVAIPSESRILKAPLAVSAGGWGQIDQGGWKSTDDPGYQRMYTLVRKTIKPSPYKDIAGTCGRDEGCLCRSCWVRKLKEDREKLLTRKQ